MRGFAEEDRAVVGFAARRDADVFFDPLGDGEFRRGLEDVREEGVELRLVVGAKLQHSRIRPGPAR